ncbi:MAG: hypothetical protein ACLQGV_06005 [Bryobacteraceae bacterium]
MNTNRLCPTPMAEAALRAHSLLEFLNAEKPDPRLWECFKISRELDSKPSPNVQSRLLGRLNRAILSGFSFRPNLYWSARREWTVGWIPVYAPHPWDPPAPKRDPQDRRQSVSVNAGLIIILEMLAAGTLERVRQCSECQKTWFFASSAKRRVCGGLCRYRKFKKAHTKAERAEYMRENRKNPVVVKREVKKGTKRS